MSVGRFLQQAAAGAGDDATYVEDVFSTYLYAGTGATQTITNGLDLAGEGGLVWIKNRDNSGGSGYHFWFDTARSPTNSDAMYFLRSDSDVAQETLYYSGSNRDFAGWASNGFTLGAPYALPSSSLNGSSEDEFCSWTFRKQPGFFDVVTYTGTGSAQNISHNLGSTPGMIIVKNVDQAYNWTVYHRSMGGYNYYNHLNQRSYTFNNTEIWNAAPTDSVFSVGISGFTNNSGDTYVAYLFAHDAQDFGEDSDEAIIKCGSYTGNGNNTGPVIDLGFEPQWVMIKDTTTGNTDWFMFDTTRNWNVVNASELKANTSASEAATIGPYRWLKPLSNGFQITDAATGLNTNGNNHIYMAIRRPHKPASKFAATDLFKPVAQNFAPGIVDAGFPIDFVWHKQRGSANDNRTIDRLRGGPKTLKTNSTAAEGTESYFKLDNMDGLELHSLTLDAWIFWMWRRAPGFFDVVAYTGTGAGNHQVTHNLGVVPEMMWIKCRSASANWQVYHSTPGATKYSPSFRTDPFYESSARWQNTAPTSSVFTVGSDSDVNGSGQTFIAYLFASVDGISKVGSYSGSGSAAINVDCGFSSGARFVLIKRSDTEISGGTGSNWYLWDSARGIVAGDDPYVLVNSNAVEVTNTDYIDPLSSGFTVTTNAPNGLNASGGTYIFYAIA